MNILIDFDSTIISTETLEFLFQEAGANQDTLEQISAITDKGMDGSISFEESLKSRLDLLTLNESQLQTASEKLVGYISESFLAVLPGLLQHNTYVISGGFQQVLEVVLEPLGISRDHLYGNRLFFKNGELVGYDTESPLASSGGKVNLAKSLDLVGTTVVIGDGATDKAIFDEGVADSFIYYSEHVDRPAVSVGIKHNASDFYQVIDTLSSLA